MRQMNRDRRILLVAVAAGALAAAGWLAPPLRAEETIEKTGSFVSAGRKSVSGTVNIVVRDGRRYVQIVDDFAADDGPDLYVFLHQQAKPKSFKRKLYTDLGLLQATSGGQWYSIPEGTEVATARSVVVRCRKFGITYGYAPLQSP